MSWLWALGCVYLFEVVYIFFLWIYTQGWNFWVLWTFLVSQMVKHLPTVWETWIWSPGQEDPLEKAMATHSSTLAWKVPWMEEQGRLQSMGSQRVGHDWVTSLSFSYGSYMFSFWEASILFSTVVAPIYIPINNIQGFLFSTSLPTFGVFD